MTASSMPLCFAYGSNMDRDAMAIRCPGSRPIGLARLPRHRLVVMREGYLSVARDPRRDVWGLLWDVAFADMPTLDRYEDVAGGLYVKRQLAVLAEAGPRRALVYCGRNAGPGAARLGYLPGVLAAAQALGLPGPHLAAIAALGDAGPAMRPAEAPRLVRPTRSSPLKRDREPGRRLRAWSP